MDLFNNNVGISYCISCSWLTSNNSISSAIMTKLNNGELKYLDIIWSPKFKPNGDLLDQNGDPNFYGTNGTNNPETATHGITTFTLLIPTNQ